MGGIMGKVKESGMDIQQHVMRFVEADAEHFGRMHMLFEMDKDIPSVGSAICPRDVNWTDEMEYLGIVEALLAKHWGLV